MLWVHQRWCGKRYLLGPLYLLMGDTESALRSFTWFAQTFPDDSGDPLNGLCWTLALYRAGELEHAAAKLRQTMLSNLYLLPRLLSMDQDHIDMWYTSNLVEQRYSDDVPEAVCALWEPAALHWASTVYQGAPMQRVRCRYVAIYHRLQTERPGPKRSRLVADASRLNIQGFNNVGRVFQPNGISSSFSATCIRMSAMIRDNHNRMRERHNGFLFAPMPGQAMILRCQSG